jgi:hypothetical protein
MRQLPRLRASLCATALCAATSWAGAATVSTFNTLASFQSSTGATAASGALPTGGSIFSSATVGSVTFSAPVAQFVNWSTLLSAVETGGVLVVSNGAGDVGGSINDGINAQFAAPVFSAGFAFHEPGSSGAVTDGCNTTCINSQWQMRLMSGASVVASVPWTFPKDQATFFGVWSDTAFNRLEIRETVGTDDNEFYGQFYTGLAAAVPEPGTAALLALGAAALLLRTQRVNRSCARTPA